MKLLYTHPIREPGNKNCIAFIDVELNEDVRLCGIRVFRKADGTHYVAAPQAGTRRTATFSPAMGARLTELAVAALGAAR